ncbi:MAG: sigma 54-dependent Fis family transcriptional regulator [Kofleriaceae bacterium]|nr:sigma 54-dependent Fis family transcriptional regulator [Kofleriaceae bacterium]MBP9168638.1 sigma 54-dependent Fis family transcriptional regulator [Kofleriaceae bacterium]MBP9857488.1 sigma 54-dependent Fis family transcriptional regulator [Kofleriaceae bacterium]
MSAPSDPGRTEQLPPAAAALSVPRFQLVVEAGPDLDRAVHSRGAALVIGSDDRAELVLTDPAVSRFHCELRVDGGVVRIRDLGSRNGTVVDGVTVVEAVLHAGAVVTVGRTRIRFAPDGEHLAVPLSPHPGFGRMAGASPAMRAVYALLERAAPTEATILLTGETGTGKEAAAESIHAASPRADGPLVVVDCGAIPPTLLEAELFGHDKGAFTGAVSARAGAFEAARGGTIFLDEIGELSLDLQPKLLRALERREVKRVGADHYHPVDVRVLAATHRDLRAEVNGKRFRADLYYRLAVVEVTLPPLRERADDLPALVARLVADLPPSTRAELTAPGFVAELARHRWPGNVRELRNYLERCAALGAALAPPPAAPAPTEAGPAVDASGPLREARERATASFERAYLTDLLRRHGDNLTAAARAAAIDRAHLYRLLWKHGLR